MSRESARAFMDKLAGDEKLRNELSSIGNRNAGRIDVSADQVAGLGARHGFTFSPDEIVEAKADFAGSTSGELDDTQLASVAGGSSKASFNDFNITHSYDKATAKLFTS